MRKILQFFFILVCIAGTSRVVVGQNEISVTGKVVSQEDSSPLPGVSVVLKGSKTGVITDGNGNYTIQAPSNGVLVFSFIGMLKEEVAINGRSTVSVSLVADATSLSEVVVVGYGASVTKKEATGATSSIKGDVIENLPMQSFDRAMQGRMAGVQITSANGTPGGAVQVRIRGTGSISAGRDPLYIVDGVQLNSRGDGGATANSNPLAFLNPNDIESIDVLKDPATAAIYGAQAGNGVVLITTKRGKAGKTKVTFNAYRGITEPIKTLDVLNTQQFIDARSEAWKTNHPTFTPKMIRDTVMAQLGLSKTLSDSALSKLPTYNWQDEVYKNGTVSNYEVALQGGNDKTTFYVSGSYNYQDAALINIDFERFSGKLSLTNKITDKWTIESGLNISTFSLSGTYGDAEGSVAFGAPQYSAPLILPFNPIYNADGSYFGMPASGVNIIGDLGSNVVANSELIRNNVVTNQAVGNTILTYQIAKGLSLRGLIGLDYRTLRGTFYGDQRLSDYYGIRGTISDFVNTNTNLSSNITANYTKTFLEKHTVSALLGAEYRKEINETTSYTAQGFPSADFITGNAAAEPVSIGGFWTSFSRLGFFTNLKYDFNKKYLVSFIVRYDGSSRFAPDSRYGIFPSISTKWNITDEAFMQNITAISELGLRVSYGTTGNDQIGNFPHIPLYGLNGVYGGFSGISPSQLGNPNLRWEQNVTLNLGLDYGLFSGRIKGAVDAFHRVSKDLLLTRSVPGTNGFTNFTENIGEVVNQGVEFEINTINLNEGKVYWETNFNITLQRNEVTKLYDGADVLPGNLSVRVGHPLFTNVAVPYAGVNPSNGRPMWYDPSGNITYLDRVADQRPLGHSGFSKFFGGFTNTVKYMNFELSAFLQYDYGSTVLNFQEFRLADNGAVLRNSLPYYWDNRWTTAGQITSIPKPANNRTEINNRISSYQTFARFYQDASYIRLKQVTLAYSVPKAILNKAKIQNVRLYVQAVNLLTWTKWTGFDPEFANLNGNGNQGIVPTSRNYTLGIQIEI